MTTWTKEVKHRILNSFLLMEDGFYLLQQNQSKIILYLGWEADKKHLGNFVKAIKHATSWVKGAKA